MYLLFRDHNITPSQFYNMPAGERAVLTSFVLRESAPQMLDSMIDDVEHARREMENEEATGCLM